MSASVIGRERRRRMTASMCGVVRYAGKDNLRFAASTMQRALLCGVGDEPYGGVTCSAEFRCSIERLIRGASLPAQWYAGGNHIVSIGHLNRRRRGTS